MPVIKSVKKAVFPVAGFGTRLLPATKVMPKEMLTVIDRPLIQMAVEEAKSAGIEQFIFIISSGKEVLLQHFTPNPALNETLIKRGKNDILDLLKDTEINSDQIFVATQEQPLGLGHAVWCARDLIGNEPFAVILPDDIIIHDEPCLNQMINTYNITGGNFVATCEVSEKETSKYGILDITSSKGDVVDIRGLVEKPDPSEAPSNMAIFGRYILQPEIFNYLGRHEKGSGGEIQLTDAMAHLIEDQDFHGFIFEGERIDCGSEIGFVKAQIAFAIRKPSISNDIANYMAEKLRAYYAENVSDSTIKNFNIAKTI